MTPYNPPIESRDTEELIFLANSSEKDWQPEANAMAKAELSRRGVTADHQEEFLKNWEQEMHILWQKELDVRRTEDYDLGEKLLIIVRWPRAIFSDWGLRKEGYELKVHRRPRLIALGVLVWVVLGFCLFLIIQEEQRKKSEQIRNTPLSPALKEYYDRKENNHR